MVLCLRKDRWIKHTQAAANITAGIRRSTSRQSNKSFFLRQAMVVQNIMNTYASKEEMVAEYLRTSPFSGFLSSSFDNAVQLGVDELKMSDLAVPFFCSMMESTKETRKLQVDDIPTVILVHIFATIDLVGIRWREVDVAGISLTTEFQDRAHEAVWKKYLAVLAILGDPA